MIESQYIHLAILDVFGILTLISFFPPLPIVVFLAAHAVIYKPPQAEERKVTLREVLQREAGMVSFVQSQINCVSEV